MMTAGAPERSLEQRMEALQRANEVRSQRADLKRGLKAGRVRFMDVIADPSPPAWLETMRVYDLLLAAPKLGRVKVNACLRVAGVSNRKTLAGLSDRQREAICAYLAARPYRPRRSSEVGHIADRAQSLAAIETANVLRLARADVRADIASGEARVVDVLSFPHRVTDGMLLGDLLRAQHRWGDYRTARFLRGVGLPDSKTVGSLTARQRGLVAEALEGTVPDA